MELWRGGFVEYGVYFRRGKRFKTLEGALVYASVLFDTHPTVEDAVMVI